MSRADYVIKFRRPQSSYTAIPNAMLRDRRLSAEARAALAWMSTMPDGWKLRASDAQATLGVGRDKWQRIVRELRDIGCLNRLSERNRKGQVTAWRHEISWAPWEMPLNPEIQMPENPVTGRVQKPENPVIHKPENPAPYKERDKYKRARASDLDRLRFFASAMKEGRYVAPSALTAGDIEGLRVLGLVSESMLRERGFA